MRRLFYRNDQAQDHLELFLVSAVSSLLLVRFYLHITGYPQLGGGTLHIAHMLWGGLLMMAAIALNLSFMGIRVQRLVALVGGIGFGLFIDELGKFITKDNNYFFQPTIGLIYAIFIILYLVFNFISRRQRLSSEEYQLNALRQFEEAIVHDMDDAEKRNMARLLDQADPKNRLTKELRALLQHAQTVKVEQGRLSRFQAAAGKAYTNFWRQRDSNKLVAAVFVIESLIFLAGIILTILGSVNSVTELIHEASSYATKLLIGQLLASIAVAAFAVWGAIKLPTSRVEALEYFRRATLVNLFLTQFFVFSRVEFEAIPGFLVNLALLAALHASLQLERRTAA